MFNVNDEIFVNGFFAIDAIDGHVIPTVVRNDFDANSKVGG